MATEHHDVLSAKVTGARLIQDQDGSESLADKQYVLFVVRLLVDVQAQVLRGELLDEAGDNIGSIRNLAETPELISRWLRRR